jgi:hypothetical protein
MDFDTEFRATDTTPTVMAESTIVRLMPPHAMHLLYSHIPPRHSPLPVAPCSAQLISRGKATCARQPRQPRSSLYLLTYVFLLYKPDGSRFPSKDPRPPIVHGWGDEDPQIAHSNKHSLFGAGADQVL